MRKFYDEEYGEFSSGGYDLSQEVVIPDDITINPSIGELYQNVLNLYVHGGICSAIDGYTPLSKRGLLKKHFKAQRPSIFSKFWWHKSYNVFGSFWWWSAKGGNEQRKLFLAHLAKKYKNKYFK